jgi:hypothetical protein
LTGEFGTLERPPLDGHEANSWILQRNSKSDKGTIPEAGIFETLPHIVLLRTKAIKNQGNRLRPESKHRQNQLRRSVRENESLNWREMASHQSPSRGKSRSKRLLRNGLKSEFELCFSKLSARRSCNRKMSTQGNGRIGHDVKMRKGCTARRRFLWIERSYLFDYDRMDSAISNVSSVKEKTYSRVQCVS